MEAGVFLLGFGAMPLMPRLFQKHWAAAALLPAGAAALLVLGNYRNPKPADSDPLSAPSPVLPAPRSKNTESRTVAEALRNGLPEISASDIEGFVDSRNRGALSMIAAFHLGGDRKWLEEAAGRYPDDPRVACAMLASGEAGEDRDAWIERLKRNDPGNATGYLYAALGRFDDGDPAAALDELRAMRDSKRQDFFLGSLRDEFSRAFRFAGHGAVLSDLAGSFAAPIPAEDLMRLNKQVASAMQGAHEAGDDRLVAELGETAILSAKRFSPSGRESYLINQLVGISMQRQALHQLDVFELVPGDSRLVADRLIEMDREISDIRGLTSGSAGLFDRMSDAQAAEYSRRLRRDGEFEALAWLKGQVANP